MTTDTIIVDRRYSGPGDSANGGYLCGRIAAFIDGPATVRLLSPPPLDTEFLVVRQDGGVELTHRGQTIATGKPGGPGIDVPDAPAWELVNEATANYLGHRHHPYPDCFVCGPHREPDDGLNVFAGPLPGTTMVASPWKPAMSLADASGQVEAVYHWAALDCPGAFAFLNMQSGPVLLGELSAEIRRRAMPNETLRVTGWQILHEGRRHITGTALFDADNHCIGLARGTWFERREA